MRSPIRLRRAAGAALSAGILLAAGCAQDQSGSSNGTKGTADAEEVLLQPAAARGPDPFTRSTARPSGSVPAPSRTGPHQSPAPGGRAVHALPGSTPGLYGGTRRVASCDVGEQIRFLGADRARSAAFAQAAGVAPAEVPDFLHGLTPVLLRADTRVTGHGFGGGSATTFQSVLQAGTAVLVDGRGLPRVRCACGNPLTPPTDVGDAAAVRGAEWDGYDPARIVVVEPAARAVSDLVIVDVEHDAWIERPSGDEGARDRAPEVPPPYDPGTDITGPLPDVPPKEPKESKKPERSPKPKKPSEPTPSRSVRPGDCPPPIPSTPPGEPAAATEGLTGPEDCPTPTGVPSDGATEEYPEPFPEMPTDEPPGIPADPDAPPQDLVPPMTDAPQTAIQLPWQDGVEDVSGGIPDPLGW